MKRIANKCAFGTLEGYIRPDQRIELLLASPTPAPWKEQHIVYEGLFRDLDGFLLKQNGKTSSWSMEHGEVYVVEAKDDILRIVVSVE